MNRGGKTGENNTTNAFENQPLLCPSIKNKRSFVFGWKLEEERKARRHELSSLLSTEAPKLVKFSAKARDSTLMIAKGNLK